MEPVMILKKNLYQEYRGHPSLRKSLKGVWDFLPVIHIAFNLYTSLSWGERDPKLPKLSNIIIGQLYTNKSPQNSAQSPGQFKNKFSEESIKEFIENSWKNT